LLEPALGAHDHPVGGDVLDHARPLGHDDRAGVTGHHVLHAGADQRRLRWSSGTAWRCMFDPISADSRRRSRGMGSATRDRHELLRRHVHVVQLVRRHHPELTALAGRDTLRHEAAVAVDLGVGLGDDELLFLQRGQEIDLVR